MMPNLPLLTLRSRCPCSWTGKLLFEAELRPGSDGPSLATHDLSILRSASFTSTSRQGLLAKGVSTEAWRVPTLSALKGTLFVADIACMYLAEVGGEEARHPRTALSR